MAIDYAISLPFFILFPVPERWSSPLTEAMLLSDKVSDKLIEFIRPMSSLDNSFPSFHVSLTVLVVAACFMFRLPMRMSALVFGATIVLSTFVLGVHWIPDIIAGLARRDRERAVGLANGATRPIAVRRKEQQLAWRGPGLPGGRWTRFEQVDHGGSEWEWSRWCRGDLVGSFKPGV